MEAITSSAGRGEGKVLMLLPPWGTTLYTHLSKLVVNYAISMKKCSFYISILLP